MAAIPTLILSLGGALTAVLASRLAFGASLAVLPLFLALALYLLAAVAGFFAGRALAGWLAWRSRPIGNREDAAVAVPRLRRHFPGPKPAPAAFHPAPAPIPDHHESDAAQAPGDGAAATSEEEEGEDADGGLGYGSLMTVGLGQYGAPRTRPPARPGEAGLSPASVPEPVSGTALVPTGAGPGDFRLRDALAGLLATRPTE